MKCKLIVYLIQSTGSGLQINRFIPTVKPQVIESFLTFDSLKGHHSLDVVFVFLFSSVCKFGKLNNLDFASSAVKGLSKRKEMKRERESDST